MLMFRSICRIKLSSFTHQFAYNSLESDVEFEIEQDPKYEIQYFIGLVFV
ncbi:hypothetical protein Hanom_Chr13g01202531 [Helianthus anomalus]